MPLLEIIIITVVLLAAISIVWGTLRLGISPMPSSKKARDAIVELIESTGKGPIVDLGSGWGSLLIPLARKYPQRKVVGYEMSLIPWCATRLLVRALKLKNIEVYRSNFLTIDFPHSAVLICYLYPAAMEAIAQKLNSENNTASVLISNNFALPSCQPEKTVYLTDFYKSPIYLYRLNEGFNLK